MELQRIWWVVPKDNIQRLELCMEPQVPLVLNQQLLPQMVELILLELEFIVLLLLNFMQVYITQMGILLI